MFSPARLLHGGACRSAARALFSSSSSSSARVQQATGSHLFKIGGYSLIDTKCPTGKPIVSAPFTVGGREWELGFYPAGILSPRTVGAVLMLTSNNGRLPPDAVAEYTVSILDRGGSPAFSRSVGPRRFGCIGWSTVESLLRLEKVGGK